MANFFNLAEKLGEFKTQSVQTAQQPTQEASEEEAVHIEETEIREEQTQTEEIDESDSNTNLE